MENDYWEEYLHSPAAENVEKSWLRNPEACKDVKDWFNNDILPDTDDPEKTVRHFLETDYIK